MKKIQLVLVILISFTFQSIGQNPSEQFGNEVPTQDGDDVIKGDIKHSSVTFGCKNGSIDLTIYDGIAPYNYTWTSIDDPTLIFPNEKLIENLQDGTYCVEVEDADCGIAQACFTVHCKRLIIEVHEVNHCTNSLEPNGSIRIIVTPSSPFISYKWIDVSTSMVVGNSQNVSGLAEGYYCVLAKNIVTGEETSECVEIVCCDELMSNEVITESCVGENGGAIMLDLFGGIPPYKLTWSDMPKQSEISEDENPSLERRDLEPGSYSLNVQHHDMQCSEDFNFVVKEREEFTLSDNLTPNFDGSYDLAITASPNNDVYTFKWQDSETQSPIRTITYQGQFSVTVTNSDGCEVSKTISIPGDNFICSESLLHIQKENSLESSMNCDKVGVIRYFINQPNIEDILPLHVTYSEILPNGERNIINNIVWNDPEELIIYGINSSAGAIWINGVGIDVISGVEGQTGSYEWAFKDKCGRERVIGFESCPPCEAQEIQPNKYKVFGKSLNFSVQCPCEDDCGTFGLTTDKIYFYLDESFLNNITNAPNGTLYPKFYIDWPNKPEGNQETTEVYYDNGDWEIDGNTEYILSNGEFDAGLPLTVNVKIEVNGDTRCEHELIFDAWSFNTEEGLYFTANQHVTFNYPIVGSEIRWGTVLKYEACYKQPPNDIRFGTFTEPLQPASEESKFIIGKVMQYYPNDYENPCNSDGFLSTLVSYQDKIINSHVYIKNNSAIDQFSTANPNNGLTFTPTIEPNQIGDITNLTPAPAYNESTMEWTPYRWLGSRTCEEDSDYKGFCIFDLADKLGVETEYLFEIAYCSNIDDTPILDEDGDNIPDDIDPCPEEIHNDCEDDNSAGGGNGGGGDDNPDCQFAFNHNTCEVKAVCENTDGSVDVNTFGGNTVFFQKSIYYNKCIYCFDADICIVPAQPGYFNEPYIKVTDIRQYDPIFLEDPMPCETDGDRVMNFFCGTDLVYTTSCSPFGTDPDDLPCTQNITTEAIVLALYELDNIPIFSTLVDTYNQTTDNLKTYPFIDQIRENTRITPNPTSGEFYLTIRSKNKYLSEFRINDLQGQKFLGASLSITKGENIYHFDVSSIPSGSYFLTYQNYDGLSITRKFQKI